MRLFGNCGITSSLGLLLGLAMGLQAASFDCTKARSRREKAVCADPTLSVLDDSLGVVFKRARGRLTDKTALLRSQREWLEELGLSESDYQPAYTERIGFLSQLVDAPWTGIWVRWQEDRPDPYTANIILMALGGQKFYAHGTTIWYGYDPQNANVGEVRAMGNWTKERMVLQSDGCQVEMKLVGERLEVVKSEDCGGMNTTFLGEYRRAKK